MNGFAYLGGDLNPFWWEKTVEYAWVIALACNRRLNFFAPLSGRHERTLGDGIFGENDKLVLVEFKRDRSQISTEESMFYNYDSARMALAEYSHHWFVYGQQTEGGKLGLCGEHYFRHGETYSAVDLIDNGVPPGVFRYYLELLQAHKEPDARGGGGGHVSSESMSTVLGISPEGELVGTMALFEYAPDLFPSPPSPQFNQNPPSRTLNMTMG